MRGQCSSQQPRCIDNGYFKNTRLATDVFLGFNLDTLVSDIHIIYLAIEVLTMNTPTSKIVFTCLYINIVIFSLIGAWNPENPYIMLIVFAGSLVFWYFILRLIFYVIGRITKHITPREIPTWRRILFWIAISFSTLPLPFIFTSSSRYAVEDGFGYFATVWLWYGLTHLIVFLAPFVIYPTIWCLKKLMKLRQQLINQLRGN